MRGQNKKENMKRDHFSLFCPQQWERKVKSVPEVSTLSILAPQSRKPKKDLGKGPAKNK